MAVFIGKIMGYDISHKRNRDIVGPQKGSATRDTEIAMFCFVLF